MHSSIESIFVELVKNGIIQECPKRTFDEYMSCDNYIDESLNKDPGADAPPPSKGRRGAPVRKPPSQKKPEQKKSKKRKADPIAAAKARAELDNSRRKLANKDPSMKEVRQSPHFTCHAYEMQHKAKVTNNKCLQAVRLVMEYCVLPLTTEMVNENAPFIKSVLLYGGPGCGKTLLVGLRLQSKHSSSRTTFSNIAS